MRELERERNGNERGQPPLALVGSGRIGNALRRAAEAAGFDARLAGREDSLRACEESGAALLCVPDGAIEEACRQVSAAVPPLRFVGHTSGATGLDVLAAAAERGAETFGLHPLQTVPDGDADLNGSPCAVSGSTPAASAFAHSLAERLGMRPFALSDESRAAYHASACIASNFLVALEESAAGLLERSGIEDARDLLAPLVLRTTANWAAHGPAALTGPIARGDEETVARHLEAIAETHPELTDLYTALAERTRRIAEGAGRVKA